MRDYLLHQGEFQEEEVSRIIPYFQKRLFRKKELLVAAGDITRQVYFINKGCVRLYLIDYTGKEHTILFGTEDYWMGDLQAFYEKSAASYSYQAIEETEAYAINKSDWDKLMGEEPSFAKYVGVLFRKALIVQQQRIVEIFTLTAEQRYERLLQQRGDLQNRIPQKYMASYIGITPEFLSQIRKKWSMNS